MGVWNNFWEFFEEDRATTLSVNARACKGMVLRSRVGEVQHLSTKQLWVQCAMQTSVVDEQEALAAESASDILTHQVGKSDLRLGFRRMEYHTPKECLGRP